MKTIGFNHKSLIAMIGFSLAMMLVVKSYGEAKWSEQQRPAPVPVQDLDIPEQRIAAEPDSISAKCPLFHDYVGGLNDNFATPVENVSFLSPAMQAFATSKNAPLRKYDEPGLDKWFAQSFQVLTCRPCRAELEVRVCKEANGIASGDNDALYLGRAPFNATQNQVVWSGKLWQPGFGATTGCKTVNIPLNIAKLSSQGNVIDLLIQDDTKVDYAKLRVWYF